MTGNLQKKKNRYYAVINTKNEMGKPSPTWLKTGILVETGNKKTDVRNEAEAKEFLKNAIERFSNTVACDMLFADFLYVWFKRKKNNRKKQLDPKTLDSYFDYIKNHLEPYFRDKGTRVCEMDEEAVEDYYDYALEHGRLGKEGGVSANSVLHYRIPLKGALALAVRKKYLTSNPALNAESPRKNKADFDFYNAREAFDMLDKVKGNEYIFPILQVTAYYGLRRSEVLGLKWSAFDFDENMFTIQHTVTQGRGIYSADKTKNQSSLRSFPLILEVKETLQEMMEFEKAKRREYGSAYVENDYIFKWPDGSPIPPDHVSHKWQKIIKKHALRRITFHQLRHPYVKLKTNHLQYQFCCF
jgi:integrase